MSLSCPQNNPNNFPCFCVVKLGFSKLYGFFWFKRKNSFTPAFLLGPLRTAQVVNGSIDSQSWAAMKALSLQEDNTWEFGVTLQACEFPCQCGVTC